MIDQSLFLLHPIQRDWIKKKNYLFIKYFLCMIYVSYDDDTSSMLNIYFDR